MKARPKSHGQDGLQGKGIHIFLDDPEGLNPLGTEADIHRTVSYNISLSAPFQSNKLSSEKK